jgi:polar amino acid transport system ATP-binding protein
MVRAVNISKSFGDLEVLKSVSMEIARGEVVCIIGPSGSGKTTFLRCINHLEQVSSGRIIVDGELIGYRDNGAGRLLELREKDAARQRAEMAMVFQQFNLFPHRTVLENLVEAPILVKRESRDQVYMLARQNLARVGLANKESAYPDQLSGGQQQRVAIARALTMRPKLMLFDEPTSALDPELVGEVLDAIRGLADDGMTMIIVTHEIGFAREVADRLVFMDGGRVVEEGVPHELIANPQQERTRAFLSKVL